MEEIPITEDETAKANEESLYIFGYLRKKYCNESLKDLDIILNSLCFSLLRLMSHHVPKDDREAMVKLIYKLLMREIKEIE